MRGKEIGGVEEDRTPDLRIANATLSQLSYHPGEGAHSTAAARGAAIMGHADLAPFRL